MANRPDCAYFLLLGLCGAAFLLTIGGILTYVGFNPGSIDGHPHSALSHIPHFHHHQQHHFSHHPIQHPKPHNDNQTHKTVVHPVEVPLGNVTHHNNVTHINLNVTREGPHQPVLGVHQQGGHKVGHHPHLESAYEAKAKQSLILAIIGPLCLLMGILVTLIVGVLALKYDCDHEPEPNIAFLRLRSEMSLNFDPDKNNYELLRPSSSIDQSGGQFSIHPTGFPNGSS